MKSCIVLVLIALVAFMIRDTYGGVRRFKKLHRVQSVLHIPPHPATTITDQCPYGIHYIDRCGIKYTCDPSTGLKKSRDQIPCQPLKVHRKCPIGNHNVVYDQANFLCYCNKEIENGDTYECFPSYPNSGLLQVLKENDFVNPFVGK